MALLVLEGTPHASSHGDAAFVSKNPKVDGTDFYAFNSYEPGRTGFVTLIANYQPFQDAYAGPTYFALDPEAIYEIHVDNNGDAKEDITFQFDFSLALQGNGLKLAVGGKQMAIPFTNLGPVTAGDTTQQNVLETYTAKVIYGDRRTGTVMTISNTAGGGTTFAKPLDNIGAKSFGDYATYANAHIYNITIPGCGTAGSRMFVGQRADPYAANLGQFFDLLAFDVNPNTPEANLIGPQDQGLNALGGKSVTTIALEVPAACLNDATDTTFGAWTTASVRQARVINPAATFAAPVREGGAWTQVSNVGMPLVNEIMIGVPDKDRYNGAEPVDHDTLFRDYFTNPTFPEIMEIQFGGLGIAAPNNFPRADLVSVYLNGITGLNATTTASEMLRLNTSIAAVPANVQNPLGALQCFDRTAAGGVIDTGNAGCDRAGFPNGRRPGDDVVDITMRLAMGFLAPTGDAPSGGLPFVDGAFVGPQSYGSTFPYLNAPRPGSP